MGPANYGHHVPDLEWDPEVRTGTLSISMARCSQIPIALPGRDNLIHPGSALSSMDHPVTWFSSRVGLPDSVGVPLFPQAQDVRMVSTAVMRRPCHPISGISMVHVRMLKIS